MCDIHRVVVSYLRTVIEYKQTLRMYRSCSQRFAYSRLNPDEVTNYFKNILDDFETKLVSKRFDQINMRMPRLIINEFKRLLKLCQENEMLSRYLRQDLFEDIYSSMREMLQSDNQHYDSSQDDSVLTMDTESSDDSYADCNIQEHSYAIQIANSFDELICNSAKNNTYIENETSNKQRITVTRRITDDKGTFFRCFLCRVSIPVGSESEDCINNNGTASLDDSINSHERNDQHRVNLLVFQSHQLYIKVHNQVEDSLQCTLCGEIFHMHLLMDHFANSKHAKRKLISNSIQYESTVSLEDVYVNNTRIEFVEQIINEKGIFTKCHLCRSLIPVATSTRMTKSVKNYLQDIIEAHKRNEIHQFNLLVFYTHQPYIKICSQEEDSFSCTLCDEAVHLDSLMNHFTNLMHTKLKLLSSCNVDVGNFNELQIDFIAQTRNELNVLLTKCHLCQVIICSSVGYSNSKDAMEVHQRQVDHRFNLLVYKSHERYINVLNQDKNFFKCNLCGQVFSLSSLMSHFTDFKHTKLKLLSSCSV